VRSRRRSFRCRSQTRPRSTADDRRAGWHAERARLGGNATIASDGGAMPPGAQGRLLWHGWPRVGRWSADTDDQSSAAVPYRPARSVSRISDHTGRRRLFEGARDGGARLPCGR
jgi:hypothetical protein